MNYCLKKCAHCESGTSRDYTGRYPNDRTDRVIQESMLMNPFRWLRNSRNGDDRRAAAHMTWAKTSVGRTISRTGVFLKRQIWIWPILAVLLLSVIGLFVRRAIETTMRDGLQSELQTVVDLEAAMLETWYHVQKSNAESLANNVDVRQTIYPLLETPVDEAGTAADVATLRAKLDKSLGPALTAHRYAGYLVADKKKRIVAAGRPEMVGHGRCARIQRIHGPRVGRHDQRLRAVCQRRGDERRKRPNADRRAHDVRFRADSRRQLPGGRRAGAADRS